MADEKIDLGDSRSAIGNLYPVDSSGIKLADVDIMDGLFDQLEALEALEPPK